MFKWEDLWRSALRHGWCVEFPHGAAITSPTSAEVPSTWRHVLRNASRPASTMQRSSGKTMEMEDWGHRGYELFCNSFERLVIIMYRWSMCTYMYKYIYIYTIYTYMHIHIYIYTYICMHTPYMNCICCLPYCIHTYITFSYPLGK